ncbi:MAG: hypothetical protein AB8G05_20870, partial [Oligoflexales bacterium]
AWAPPRSFDFPTIIAFLEKLGKFAKDYSALSLTYKGGGVFPIRHYIYGKLFGCWCTKLVFKID